MRIDKKTAVPTRRAFLKSLVIGSAGLVASSCSVLQRKKPPVDPATLPNIVLVMADDLGYGDVGYNGNTQQKTPNLDAMSREAVRMDRFYAAASVCSPTRGSCLTGRHPSRYNIQWAGENPLPREEITLAEALKTQGYATGHFGKWHLGTLCRSMRQNYFAAPVAAANYSPPWEHGFDECFSTESMVPTYNPSYHVGGEYGTAGYRNVQTEAVSLGQEEGGFWWRDHYWTGPGQMIDGTLQGDDSEIIMNRALAFMEKQVQARRPFLSVIWFHAPHTPVVAGNKDRVPYAKLPMEAQHWHGCISAMDRQIGLLRKKLEKMQVSPNTIVWFCSSSGPSHIHDWGSTKGLRGKKGTLFEGGIRVPALVEWPARLLTPRTVKAPICTSDFYPTLLKVAGVEMKKQPPLDGIDVLPLLEGRIERRLEPILFQSPSQGNTSGTEENVTAVAVVGDRFKLVSLDGGQSLQLFDLEEDPGETTNVSGVYPDTVRDLRASLLKWQESCLHSAKGEDYR